MLKKQIADLGVPDVQDFLDQIVAVGGHLWARRVSADMNHLSEGALPAGIGGLPGQGSASPCPEMPGDWVEAGARSIRSLVRWA